MAVVPALEILAFRSGVLQAVRTFFTARGYLEVETPVRVPQPALELHIDAEPSGRAYLRTSPELYLKRLLAAGIPRLFELGPCFRRGERGERHNPEYTMLEWYRAGADYRDAAAETRDLLCTVARALLGSTRLPGLAGPVDVGAEWLRLTVAEAFATHAGWNPVTHYDADRFDLDLVNLVEPALPRDRPVILTDYPPAAAALARLRPDTPPVAERWELYVGGMELANAYGELTDPLEQRARFARCAADRRALGKEVYAVDEEFLRDLSAVPACAGVALGLDRLVMLAAGVADIAAVRAFCP